jgi:uncharacterized protein YcbX
VQAGSRSAFPWLTARELPELLHFRPVFTDDGPRPRVLVTTPDGRSVPVDDDALLRELEERAGRPLYLLQDHRGCYDIAYLSLISTATLRRIADLSDMAMEPGRFRANLVIDTSTADALPEPGWVGHTLRLGEAARIAVTEQDRRCAIITLHPDTASADPEVLRAVARSLDSCAGVYASVLTPGTVRPGDPVLLEA